MFFEIWNRLFNAFESFIFLMNDITEELHVTPFEYYAGDVEDDSSSEESDSGEKEDSGEDDSGEDDSGEDDSGEEDSGEDDSGEDEDEEHPTKIKFISIEGNIAAGKTTLIHRLKDKYRDRDDILFLEEPVDIWNTIQDKNGKTILQYFYKDLAKYAFAFQVMAYTTRLQLIKDTIANASPKVKVVVMERSLEADANIFAKMLHEEGLMNTIEYQVYSLMTENNWEDYGVDGIIWLHTEPDECYSRVQSRNREGEEGIDLGYLRKCHQYHLEWLGANLGFVCNIGEGEGESEFDLESDLEKIDNYLF